MGCWQGAREIGLQKGGDVRRRGGSGEMVAVYLSEIRTRTEVLGDWMIWCGGIDKELL